MLPVSGLFTVTVPVMVTAPPTGMFPVLATSALFTMFSPGTRSGTVTVHRESVEPDLQLLPAVTEVTVLARILSPRSGLFTVTE